MPRRIPSRRWKRPGNFAGNTLSSPRRSPGSRLDTFDAAYHIIGGGEEGDKTLVRTKEQADHSLPYLVAVMLLDGQVKPEQFRAERIARRDVQNLLRKVVVRPVDA